ncbi:MAG TPA: NYN domain-containing protein [Actinomycetota bacterium]
MSDRARWLVDGMNVIGSRPDRWWNDPDRAVHRMVGTLQAFAARTGGHVIVVFDRRPPDLEPGPHDGVEVAFPHRRGRNAADHEIVEMLSADEDPTSIRVVTSDARLAERVRDLGARVTSSGSFLRRLGER